MSSSLSAPLQLLQLLQAKNRALDSMLSDTQSLLESQSENESDLDAFEKRLSHLEEKRSRLFRGIELLDQRIRTLLELHPEADFRTQQCMEKVQGHLLTWRGLVEELVSKDKLLTELTQTKQQELSRSIQQTKKQTEAVGKFKSQWIAPSGEGVDRKV